MNEQQLIFQKCQRVDELRAALVDIEKRLFDEKLLASLPIDLKCQAYRVASVGVRQSLGLLHAYRIAVAKLRAVLDPDGSI